jgi:hypothetical protein
MIDSSFEVVLWYKAHPGKEIKRQWRRISTDSRPHFLFLPFCQPPLLCRRLVPSCARLAARRSGENLERGTIETAGTVGTGLKLTLLNQEVALVRPRL